MILKPGHKQDQFQGRGVTSMISEYRQAKSYQPKYKIFLVKIKDRLQQSFFLIFSDKIVNSDTIVLK